MRGTSNKFQQAVVTSHEVISRVDVIQNGQIVQQLAVHDGSVTADRTAAQMRTFDVSVSDPTGTLTPQGMASLLAPFGTRLQIWRGIRLQDVSNLVQLSNTQSSWQVSTPSGQMNGVVGDSGTGELRLGP